MSGATIPFLSLLVLTAQSSAPNAGDQSVPLQSIADASDQNRASFAYGTLEFEFWKGPPTSIERARRGDLKDAHMAKCRYVFDDANALFTQMYDPDEMAATHVQISDERSTDLLVSHRVLTNDKLTIEEALSSGGKGKPPVPGYRMVSGTDAFYRIATVPYDLGHPRDSLQMMSTQIQKALRGSEGGRVLSAVEEATWEGRKVCRFSLELLNGSSTYDVDLERGAIPIRIHTSLKDGTNIDEFLDDIRFIDGRGYLPFASTVVYQGGFVMRTVVSSADFTRKPALDEFKLEFSRPVALLNAAEHLAYTPRKVWDLHKLPKRGSKEATPVSVASISPGVGGTPPPILEGEREAPRPPYFLIAGVVCALAIGVYAWRRHRGAKS